MSPLLVGEELVPAAQRWYLRRSSSGLQAFLRQVPALDPILARVLYARGVATATDAHAFLAAEGSLSNPFDMADMAPAVSRLRRAIATREPIVVYGDFDVDGICATVLLTTALAMLGAVVSPYIPDRFSESYGVNKAALKRLHSQGARLLITVDCGIRSRDEIAYGRSLGLDIIVTDHHSLPPELPEAIALLNPKRPDCGYPFKHLSGVGVAYRLVDALFRVAGCMSNSSEGRLGLESFLDLVALGTVADIVPLIGENRLLAQWGLEHMRRHPRPGLAALLQVSQTAPEEVDSQVIGFRLGPRINAAGRLKHARLAYSLLTTDSSSEADRLAHELDAVNGERQRLLEEQVSRAREIVEESDMHLMLFAAAESFHEGIVGLIASRLSEEYYRPALVMRRGKAITRGSARSIEGFHITRALDACSDLLSRYGGHAQAAGYTLVTENLGAFRERLLAHCEEHITDEILMPRVDVDAIISLDDLTAKTPQALALLEPCGEGNPPPMLASRNLILRQARTVGRDGKHLRLALSSESGRTLTGIAFRMGHLAAAYSPGDRMDLVYTPTLNTWQGQETLELVIHALRPTPTDSL